MGLQGHRGLALPMDQAHQHDDIELNWTMGEMTYFVAGRVVQICPGQLTVMWGAVPHRLLSTTPETHFVWITLPLAQVLSWSLPGPFLERLLKGELLREPDPNLFDWDGQNVTRWLEDLEKPRLHGPLLLECRARLERLALALEPLTPYTSSLASHDPAERLAHFLREHYTQAIHARDAARAVGLNPNYASTLFRERFALTLTDYLTRLRLSHAQRLLVTTRSSVLDIAFESGFASPSRFYTAFALLGCSPLEYRRRLVGTEVKK